jgi:hypothetical protein
MKRGIGFGKIGMNLGSLQIREKDAAEEKSGPDEGGGFGIMDKAGGGGFGKMDKAGGGGFGKMDKAGDGGGFGKMDKAGVGAGKIDNLLESEKGAGEEEYRQGKYISRRRRNINLVSLLKLSAK